MSALPSLGKRPLTSSGDEGDGGGGCFPRREILLEGPLIWVRRSWLELAEVER